MGFRKHSLSQLGALVDQRKFLALGLIPGSPGSVRIIYDDAIPGEPDGTQTVYPGALLFWSVDLGDGAWVAACSMADGSRSEMRRRDDGRLFANWENEIPLTLESPPPPPWPRTSRM